MKAPKSLQVPIIAAIAIWPSIAPRAFADAYTITEEIPFVNYGQATGVNNSGEVVGEAFNSSGYVNAFSYTSAGGMIDLGTLGGRL
jgi:probable HAF family extracellular repeat protein